MVLADSDRIARVPPYLGTPLGLPSAFAYAAITLFGAPFQALPLATQGPTADPQPRRHLRDAGLGLSSRFARHYYGNHSLFSFPQGTEMFHFPWFAPEALWIQASSTAAIHRGGFPHSDISGSTFGWQLPGAFRSHPRPSSPLIT
jgi:hypothetical protein